MKIHSPFTGLGNPKEAYGGLAERQEWEVGLTAQKLLTIVNAIFLTFSLAIDSMSGRRNNRIGVAEMAAYDMIYFIILSTFGYLPSAKAEPNKSGALISCVAITADKKIAIQIEQTGKSTLYLETHKNTEATCSLIISDFYRPQNRNSNELFVLDLETTACAKQILLKYRIREKIEFTLQSSRKNTRCKILAFNEMDSLDGKLLSPINIRDLKYNYTKYRKNLWP